MLCFDEVMTGFRIAKGCAQEYFGVTPDLTTMGKVCGPMCVWRCCTILCIPCCAAWDEDMELAGVQVAWHARA